MMATWLIAAVDAAAGQPENAAGIGLGVLAVVVIAVIGAVISSGSSGTHGSPPPKVGRGGFRPVGTQSTPRQARKVQRPLPSKSNVMRGHATKRKVDWLTGEKTDG